MRGCRAIRSQFVALQTALPTRAPMPAVTAIATAPQKPTRNAGRTIFAPPSHAPSAPSASKKTRAAVETASIVVPGGDRNAARVGSTAPTEKAAADAKAARMAFAPASSVRPSSSRAWALSGSFTVSCSATLRANWAASSAPLEPQTRSGHAFVDLAPALAADGADDRPALVGGKEGRTDLAASDAVREVLIFDIRL